MIEWVLEGKSLGYDGVPLGARITAVNGCKVLATCESCDKSIFDETDLRSDADGVELCAKCYGELVGLGCAKPGK